MNEAPRFLSLDVGERRIGVAVSDPLGITAQPVEVVWRGKPGEDIKRIWQLIDQYRPARVICGLPRSLSGGESAQAEYTRAFIGQLLAPRQIPVLYWDERLTTAAASRALLEADISRKKRKTVVDKIAACLILQNYLDAGAPEDAQNRGGL